MRVPAQPDSIAFYAGTTDNKLQRLHFEYWKLAPMQSFEHFWYLFLRTVREGSSAERISLIRKGVPAFVIAQVAKEFRCTQEEVCSVTGASPANVRRKAADGGWLGSAVAERLARMIQIERIATEAFGSKDSARAWLKLSHPWLHGQTPLAMLDTEDGAELVRRALYCLLHGDPS